MDYWNFLQLAPTKDEKEIKKAYSKLLKVYHPEKDNEGFMRLREAYEQALQWARQEESEETELTPVDIWMQKVEGIYATYKTRIDISCWEALLDEDVVIGIDSANECNQRLLIFLADHILVPHEVLHVLEKYFRWEHKRENLIEYFPENYIDYLIANAKYPDNFRYLLLNPDLDINYDAFLEDYFQLEREIQNENADKIKYLLERVENCAVQHPDVIELRMRAYLFLKDEAMVETLCGELLELAPEDMRTWHAAARFNLELGHLDTALEYYDKILAQKEHVGAMLGKAACYREMKRYEDAIDVVNRAQEILPFDGYVRNFQIMLNEDLLASRKQAYEAEPENQNYLFEYCKSLADGYHFKEAVELLPKLDESAFSELAYCEVCSRAYMDMENNNVEKAIPYLERLVELKPDKQSYYEDLGYCYGECGKLEKAKQTYAKSKEIDKTSVRIYYRMAQIYIKEENYQQAVEVCDEGLSYNDNVPNLYHFKAEACYYLKEYRRALALCDRAIGILPYVDTYEIKAKIYNECEAYEETVNLIKDMLDTDFMSDMLLAQYARAKRHIGVVAEATQLLDKAIERGSDESEIYYQRGVIYYISKSEDDSKTQFKKAFQMADEALSRMREFSTDYLMLKTQSLRQLGRLSDAVKLYRHFEQKGHFNERMALALGDCFMEMHKAKEAETYFRKALELNPKSYQSHGRICDALMEQQRMEEALQEVEQQLQIEASDYYYIDRGIIYNELFDKEKAEENYRLALDVNESNPYAWCNLAFLLKERGRLEESCEAFAHARQFGHPNPLNFYEEAKLRRRLQQSDQAIQLLEQLLENGVRRYYYILLLADLYAETDDFERAERCYELLLEKCPDGRLDTIVHWADSYKHVGMYHKMLEVWRNYLGSECKNSYAYNKFMGGYYMYYTDDARKAIKYYKRAFKQCSQDGYVCSKLGVLYEHFGKMDKALQMYQTTFDMEYPDIADGHSTDPCSYDCVGMDYAWLGNYDKAAEMFYQAIYYGRLCDRCSSAQCYEVYYDIADMMERKADAIRANTIKNGDLDALAAWAKTCRNFFADYENGLYEDAFFAPTAEIVKELEEFVATYMEAKTYKQCIMAAAKYYHKAQAQKPHKVKYNRALKRIRDLIKTWKQ